MSKKLHNHIVIQSSSTGKEADATCPHCDSKNLKSGAGKIAQQQAIFQKPQISSVPNVSPKERNRYQVTLGDRLIVSGLNVDDATKLTSLIRRKQLTPAIEFLEKRGIVSEQAQLLMLTVIGGEL
ncbi:MAG TPA: hypothetical protein V6D11_07720 [Waterburya sp.]|jgi:hypothetical protein